jgi:hypothetical protein
MPNNLIKNLKRKASQITEETDIITTDDNLINLAKRIYFIEKLRSYKKRDLSVYQIEPCVHPMHPNVVVAPHFIRDDGVVIYLQIMQNNKLLNSISDEIIHTTMEILKLTNAVLCTIYLKSDIKIETMGTTATKILKTCYQYVSEKIYKFDPKIVKAYISSFYHKKVKTNEIEDNQIEIPNLNPNPNLNPSLPVPSVVNNNSNQTDTMEIDNDLVIEGFVPDEWVSASKTRNYVLKNTIDDWLDMYQGNQNNSNTHHSKTASNKNSFNNVKSSPQTEYDFVKFIMNKGTAFESNVIQLIRQKVNQNEFVTICPGINNLYNKIPEYERMTIDEIMKGTPIIYQPVMMNRSGKLCYSYGLPDLLIRSDYLGRIIDTNPLSEQYQTYKAPKLNGNYHYVVVDIKFTSLELCADGRRIRNSGSVPAYKCQLYIYNHALGMIQGYEPPESYILGRKYKYETKGKHYFGNSCFSRFGVIEYDDWDSDYVNEAINAIKWIRTLRTHGNEWKLLPKPSINELYPNMSCISESPWDSFKEEYARKIGEISLLWNCGVKNREIAHANGVHSFFDANCSSETVGIKGPKQAPILNEIIKINRQTEFESVFDRIKMKINQDIDNRWTENSPLRFSADFETVNSVFDNFTQLPIAEDNNFLFMIGVGYVIPNKPIQYKMFLVSELSKNAEFQMMFQFYQFVRGLTDEYLGKNHSIPQLYHWGHIERSYFNGLCKRVRQSIGPDIDRDVKTMEKDLEWFDLSECFKGNPIVINGCFKFGLKEVAGRLYELGLISSTWQKGNSCANGNTAMVMAHKAYQTSATTGIPIINSPIIQDIIDYNRIDCVVIHEIIDFLKLKAESN